MPTLIARYRPGAADLSANLLSWLPEHSVANWQWTAQTLVQAGVAADLAQRLTALDFIFPALDMVNLAAHTGLTLEQVARTYFAVENRLGLMVWRSQIKRLPTDTLWQTQARASARDDVYAIASQIAKTVLANHASVDQWAAQHVTQIERTRHLQQTIGTQVADLAAISVALRELRHLT
jgi:glutamate dehydrogenase